jgi:phenylalanyl-tRNA synthetase beta chain
VTPPSYRFDLAIEEDFVEEVARLYGYDRIPAEPSPHTTRMLTSAESRRTPTAVKRALVERDWQEVITYTFVSSATEALLVPEVTHPTRAPIRVLNPIAAHMDVMRTTLLPGLLDTLRTNVNRKAPRVRIFEVGRAFRHADPATRNPFASADSRMATRCVRNGDRARVASICSMSKPISKRLRIHAVSQPKSIICRGYIQDEGRVY